MCYPSSEDISPNPVGIQVKVLDHRIIIYFGTAMPASGQHYHQNLPTKSSSFTHTALTSFWGDLGPTLAEHRKQGFSETSNISMYANQPRGQQHS